MLKPAMHRVPKLEHVPQIGSRAHSETGMQRLSERDLPIFPRSSLKLRVGALEMLQREFSTEGPDETRVPEKAKCRLGGQCHPGLT